MRTIAIGYACDRAWEGRPELGGCERRLALTAVLALAIAPHARDAFAEPAAAATQAALSGDKTALPFRIEMTAGVTAEIFTLANPYRVIVDLPDVSFRLPDGTGRDRRRARAGVPLWSVRGQEGAHRRLVRPALYRIERAAMTAAPADKGVIFTFDMVTTAPESFGLGTGADRAARSAGTRLPPIRRAAPSPSSRGKPIIMIDPGPRRHRRRRRQQPSNILEKNVVLAVGKELARQLSATGRYDVRLTRSSDIFISLDQRLSLLTRATTSISSSRSTRTRSRDANGASGIRGATVYTLSERASDEHAPPHGRKGKYVRRASPASASAKLTGR